jgi:colanic acid biosynthesis glycosyl transferase WcaI
MRILFVNRFFYPDHSATSQSLSDLAFFLARRGHDISVITSRQRYDDENAILTAFENVNGVRVHRVWISRFGRGNLLGRAIDYLSFYVAALLCLLRILKKCDVVVAKTDPPLISVVAALAARIKGARLVNWLQDVFPEVGRALGVKVLLGVLGRWSMTARDASLRQAAVSVVRGDRMAAHVLGRDIALEQVVTIHNWADDQAIVPISHEANSLRRQWGFDGKFVVAYSGNLGRAHEFGSILEAARMLDGNGDIVFLFIGAGAQFKAVGDYVAMHGLHNVTMRPYQPREKLVLSLGAGDLHLVSLAPPLWLSQAQHADCSIRVSNTPLSGRSIFVYAGNMGVAQGMDILLDLAERMRARQDVGFLFVGRGSEAKRLAALAQTRELDNVVFHDEIDPDEIPGLYVQCNVGLVALDPRHKSHIVPGKFLTYMQSGLPVLGCINRGNDLAEIIQRENVGRVSEDNSVVTLHRLAGELLESLNADVGMPARCKGLFADLFSVEAAARQVIAALNASG